ncbi:LacI family DNA-binding transcriptional regulator [Pseudobacillus badius]|nr:LacI family DNA-binding transcriptional regulator [Bacillus badius]KZN98392.1 LacI family transcriptional regulator [Bacillus badius]OCS82759.1 LacI family transcriptional regulator [Bacillus badius]OVE51465.1 LacI family transcriptional regulator [Bacillus badius]TDW02579.1 LacI family transcriptional regulator [Bacillus badius]UAT30633.1 LacI family transcriptional regulator [Bacillus badius]
MVTIRDVAAEAGVSVATVSRVLNNKGYVHEDTLRKVQQAIEKLNYSPNEVARSLFKRQSKLVGLLLPDITNPFFPELARGVEDELQKQGFRLLFGNSDENPEKEQAYIETFLQNQVVGIISATQTSGMFNQEQPAVPTVFLDRTHEGRYTVYADGREGGKIAARELVRRGSRNITVLKGPGHISPVQDRFLGAVEVLAASSVDFQVIQMASLTYEEAEERAKELFRQYPATDGILASNDMTAAAVLHEALRIGKAIPEEVQIIGFDDIPMSRLLFPSLSTIKQPVYEMGKQAAQLLLKLIKKEEVAEQVIQLPVSFVERNTTRKVKADG